MTVSREVRAGQGLFEHDPKSDFGYVRDFNQRSRPHCRLIGTITSVQALLANNRGQRRGGLYHSAGRRGLRIRVRAAGRLEDGGDVDQQILGGKAGCGMEIETTSPLGNAH